MPLNETAAQIKKDVLEVAEDPDSITKIPAPRMVLDKQLSEYGHPFFDGRSVMACEQESIAETAPPEFRTIKLGPSPSEMKLKRFQEQAELDRLALEARLKAEREEAIR